MTDPINIAVIYAEREGCEIQTIAEQVSDPHHVNYAKYRSRERLLDDLVSLSDAERKRVHNWLGKHGIQLLAEQPPTPQLDLFSGTLAQIEAALGPHAARWLGNPERDYRPRMLWTIPNELSGLIKAIDPTWGGRGTVEFEGQRWLGAQPINYDTSSDKPDDLLGFTPTDIAELYGISDAYRGEGQTIGLLVLAPAPDLSDIHQFWHGQGVDRGDTRVHIVHVGPEPTMVGSFEQLETAMTIEWAGAMAPASDIVVYIIDPQAVPDPWVTFLMTAIADTIRRPTVLCTTWLQPERHYYSRFGPEVIAGLLNQCAATGITVVAPTGDWGCFDSFPTDEIRGERIADAPWPQAVFPAVEQRVLAVGGTMIQHRTPRTETAWSGPLPPNLTGQLAFQSFASGGGFSNMNPIPKWQRPHLLRKPDLIQLVAFDRGPGVPAVLPYGRGIPDVSLAAVGRSIQREGDTTLSADGYQAVVGGVWIDFAGGTSLSAAIWAALIARLNQAREVVAGRPWPLGDFNPLLYSINRTWEGQPDLERTDPLHDVCVGHSDVNVRTLALDHEGRFRAFFHRIPGYRARPSWDPITGLGTPHLQRLSEAVIDPTCWAPLTKPD